MTGSLPKLRSDLTVRRQQTAQGSVSIIKDPATQQFFRLREAEQFIASQLDGETSLDEIRRRAEERFEAALPAETLERFVRGLERNGLLDSGNGAAAVEQEGRFRGSLLYLRFRIFNPTWLLDRLDRPTRLLFTPHFVIAAAAVILIAAGTLVANWNEYVHDLSRLYRLSTIPLFVALSFIMISAHELAHGLTCRRFGGDVRDMGFLLIYFQPAFYCNVSDAWLFPERSRRLWVGFAGPYFELFLWGLATLAWRVTDTETVVNHLALIVMTASGIKTLLNLNPFLKLDGYYLLSDYLGIPNLRRKSFRLVGDLMGRLFRERPPSSTGLSPRERRVCAIYGLLATAFSFAFMGYVLVTAGSYLIASGQQAGFVLVAGLLGARARHRVRGLFGVGAPDPSDPVEDEEPVASRPTLVSEEGPRARKKTRKKRSWIRPVAWTLAAIALVVLLFKGQLELRVAGPFNVRPVGNAEVRAAIAGIVGRVEVDEGDQVAEGDPIARLVDTDLRAEFLKAEAEIREAQAQLQLLQKGPTAEEIEVAKVSAAKATDLGAYARSRLSRLSSLFEDGLVSRKELEDQQELTALSRSALTEAQARLDALLSSVRPEQIEAAKARIERLNAHRRYLEGQLELPLVTSPVTGVVATPSRELKELPGRLVQKGDLIANVYDFRTVTAYITISEREIADVAVGQTVALRARAYPHMEFHGTVTAIATSAQAGATGGSPGALPAGLSSSADGSNKTILVTTQIDNQALLLRPEMTGQAKIYCGDRRIVDLVTRRVARTLKVEVWSWW